jgi:putative phosphoesterase
VKRDLAICNSLRITHHVSRVIFMKIGVISDTHGFLDPRIFGLFAGVGHILHAGDIGPDSIIRELEAIAPVTAVLGNTDSSSTFKLTEMVTLDGRKFLVHHIVDPYALKEELRLRLARARPDAVVFGHTHRASCQTIDGTLFFNPGYAGKPKSGAERSVAILQDDGKEIRHEFLPL